MKNDDEQEIMIGEIPNIKERVDDLAKMGKTLGISPLDWSVILQAASLTLQKFYGFKIEGIEMAGDSNVVQCPCPQCKKRRAREKFNVVKN